MSQTYKKGSFKRNGCAGTEKGHKSISSENYIKGSEKKGAVRLPAESKD